MPYDYDKLTIRERVFGVWPRRVDFGFFGSIIAALFVFALLASIGGGT